MKYNSGSGATLVKTFANDYSTGPGTWGTAQLGTSMFFSAYDSTNGIELWVTDGTSSGTVMVKDINSGSGGSYLNDLTVVGNTLYFRADDGNNGAELWKTDGTTSGTIQL